MTAKCNLCLFYCPPSSMENDDLRRMVDKVFYFKIFRTQNDPTLICETCKGTVDRFYEYAENVWRNQQFLRESSIPSTSSNMQVAAKVEIDPQLGSQKMAKKVKEEEEDEDNIYEAKAYVETSYDIADETARGNNVKTNREWMAPEGTEEADNGNESDDSEGTDSDAIENQDETAEVNVEKPKRKYTPNNRVVKTVTPKMALEEQLLQHYKLSCDLCSEPLASFAELMAHFKHIHNQQGYLKCCNKKIQRKYWMIEHIQVHLNPDAFQCVICKKSYSSSRVLKEHIKEVHTPNEERAIKCETCQKPFATQRALSSHLMAAHGSVPCPQCPKLLASQGSLKKHLVMMHGEGEQYVCDICAKVFRSKPCFDKHVKIHMGTFEAERVQCGVCFAWLTDKYCLRKHMRRIHSNEDEVVDCGECGRPQRNQIMLKMHVARAHGESRFECEICLKKFKRSHHMREHKAIHHTGEELYGCDYCPERFNNKNKQCLHRKMCHPVEFEEEMRKRTGGVGVLPVQHY
ncbi:zinc finger protein 557-like [Ochlerotatus camptorhynchus]|uniref:zinc finger protein 557-like n=1 Tax=Ochlerotatus camptorhynchus TaxID=644619 RepID=UPI0031DE34FA